MLIGITGTPGTGKTAVAEELRSLGYPVLDLKSTIKPFVLSHDDEVGADVVDVDSWSEENAHLDGLVEGAIAHFLPCDKIVVLRCRPDILKERLIPRGYSEKKVKENLEAEALDVILIETVDSFATEQIYEIDTTNIDEKEVANRILAFMNGTISASFGLIDWSEYVMSI